jgi:DNA-binding response OmpR family regulator
MPGMIGFDCLKEIRKIKPDIPAIFLTGSIDRSRHIEELKALNCGLDDVLQKPIDLNKLIGHIREKLGGQVS